MKNIFRLSVCMLAFCLLFACGKKEQPAAPAQELKYAKAEVAVFKDPELTAWGANLAKTEEVAVLERTTVKVKNTDTAVAKVKLSDGSVFYIRDANLAGTPVVFTAETDCYARNNEASKVYCTVPAGTIAFVNLELNGWTQIYAGQIGQKWVTQQWVKDGISSDPELIASAKKFHEAAAVLKNEKSTQEQISKAVNELRDTAARNTGSFLESEISKLLKHFEPAEQAETDEPVPAEEEPDASESEN